MVILIDNGHGENTPGKCSPDLTHREWLWTRQFGERLVSALVERGYDARRITPERTDISIRERVSRVNNICKEVGARNVVLVSLHNDASGADGKWHEARGFSARVGMNASKKSQVLASLIAYAADDAGITVRRPLATRWYWVQNLGICQGTKCPAVLTESLFQDNKEDVELLHDEDFLVKLCEAHVKGIESYIKNYAS